jgi:hypothetical protein
MGCLLPSHAAITLSLDRMCVDRGRRRLIGMVLDPSEAVVSLMCINLLVEDSGFWD